MTQFVTNTPTMTTTMMPCTTGKSRPRMESTSRIPTPGRAKIVSVTTAPLGSRRDLTVTASLNAVGALGVGA